MSPCPLFGQGILLLDIALSEPLSLVVSDPFTGMLEWEVFLSVSECVYILGPLSEEEYSWNLEITCGVLYFCLTSKLMIYLPFVGATATVPAVPWWQVSVWPRANQFTIISTSLPRDLVVCALISVIPHIRYLCFFAHPPQNLAPTKYTLISNSMLVYFS